MSRNTKKTKTTGCNCYFCDCKKPEKGSKKPQKGVGNNIKCE